MEDDKRRRKNKKKRNKQSKNAENGVGEIANRDQNLTSNGKGEHTILSETENEKNSNGVGDISVMDKNMVNGKDEPAHLSGVSNEQSVNEDRNGVVEVPYTDQNLVKSGNDEDIRTLENADGPSTSMSLNGHLPNGKECVSFPSTNLDFRLCFKVYANDSSAIF